MYKLSRHSLSIYQIMLLIASLRLYLEYSLYSYIIIYLKKEKERAGKREERESECVSEGVSERERENKREK